MRDALLLAFTHVSCLVGGVYLCYAILSGRLLTPRKFSMQKQAEGQQQYRVNREEEPEGFVSQTLKGYELDREKYLRDKAGTMPLPKPPKGDIPKGYRNDEFGRAAAFVTAGGVAAPGGAKSGRLPQGTPEGDGASKEAPDRAG